MVDPEDFKGNIRKLISQDYKMGFLGDDFDKIAARLTKVQADKIYGWVNSVINSLHSQNTRQALLSF